MTFDVKEGHLDATMVAEVMGKLIQFVKRVPSSDSSESICSTLCVHNRVVVCDKCCARSVWDPLAQQLSECEACRFPPEIFSIEVVVCLSPNGLS